MGTQRIVKIPAKMAERMERAAKREGLTLSAFVRRAATLEANEVLTRDEAAFGARLAAGLEPDDDGDGEG
jgi:uncharacterized protein (DUF1778 family)